MTTDDRIQLEREKLELRNLLPEEATALVACLRRCYGESYVDPTLYDADGLERSMRAGLLHPLVAINENGEVVGHMSLTLRRAGDLTADAGTTLVDPRYRGLKIATAVSRLLGRRAQELGLVGAHDYPVTVHAATQKLGAGFGTDTGLLLDNMPAEVRFEQMDTEPGRSASLIRYLPFSAAPPRDVFVAQRYRERLSELYARMRLTRRLLDGEPLRDAADIVARFDTNRAILRIEVRAAGSDLDERVERATLEHSSAHAVQIDLCLCDARAAAATDALREHGFFYGGLLPEYRDGDVFRLQRLAEPSTANVPVLSTPDQRELAAFVLAEATAAAG